MTIRRNAVWTVGLVVLAAGAAARAAGAGQYRTEPQITGRISFEEFKKLYDKDAVLILDVRDANSYRNGHIPGSISIPLNDVAPRAEELKKEKRPIVTYCA